MSSAKEPLRPWYWPPEGQPHRTEPFTWIVEDKIAASWWPDQEVFQLYKKNNIKAIVNCCEFDNRDDVPEQFDYYHINIPDYGIPRDDQIDYFIKIMEQHSQKDESVVIHCVAGCGRTGQFIIAWCAKASFLPKDSDPTQWIRERRKCCLETDEQIKRARELAEKYWA